MTILLVLLLTLLSASSAALFPRPARAQDEFLLNDDRVERNQWAPHVALGSRGTLLFVWMDGRNGTPSFVDYDIYLVSLRDPLSLGSSLNRRVNDDAPGPAQGFPDVAGSPAGTFLCAWEDGRFGNRDIYAAALDSLGVPITPGLRVNDDVGPSDQLLPRVAALGPDRYLVVWGDGREGQGEIYASYRTATGAPLGANQRISVDPVPGGSYQGEPAVAVNGAGRILVVWLDGREGGSVIGATFDVYGQWLDADGAPLGGNFKVNDTSGTQRCASVAVAADSVLGFVAAWIDRRNAPSDPGDVYAQRFDAARAAVGPNVRVNDDASGRDQRNLRAASGSGAAVLVWEDQRGNLGTDSNVEASLVPYGSGAPGANMRVNTDTGGRQGTPAVAWDGRDAYIAVWEDGRHGAPDVFALSFYADGSRRGSDAQLNDDAARNDQRHPRVGRGTGRYVATWIDRRSQTDDLYGQWITAAGARDGPNHLLMREDALNRPVAASSAVLPSGVGLVAAQVARVSDSGEIRGFLYTALGSSPARSFWVSDDLPSAQAQPAAAASDSTWAVVWIDGREGTPRLYGQRLASDGTRLAINHPVLTNEPDSPVYALDLEAAPDGGYWLLYCEGNEAEQRLWLARLTQDLTEASAPVPVSPEIAGRRSAPVLGVSADERVELAWLGSGADGLALVYHQTYVPGLGFLPSAPVRLEGSRGQAGPSIAVSGSGSIVAWEESGIAGDWNIWLQRYDGGAPVGSGPVRVDQDVTGAEQLDPCAALDASGHVLVVWSDTRSVSSGVDILGRTFALATTAADDPPPDPDRDPPPPAAPGAFRIGPARPNPFSSTTATPLEIPAADAGRVAAFVWNARGERVATLFEGTAPVGRLTLRWDGRGRDGRPAASGVYWITVESRGERRATRVVHLR